MALKKCPKCELNYVREGAQYCDVCLRGHKRIGREAEAEEEITICTECGEAPVVPGGEFCLACLKEQKRQAELESALDLDAAYDEAIAAETPDEDDDEE